MKRYYFLSSSHLEDRIWFRDDEDFKAGMNFVAITTVRCTVDILMSNHVHFILLCERQEADRFYNTFKQEYARYFRSKYHTPHLLRRNAADIRLISTENEGLERVGAYLLCNPPAANICVHPSLYLWGCGRCLFSGLPSRGQDVGTFSTRQRRVLLHSKFQGGKGLIYGEDGYILPESYIRKDIVEAVFRTPNRLEYFLRTSSKVRQIWEGTSPVMPTFRDQSIAGFADDIRSTLFRKKSVSDLDEDEVKRLVHETRRRSGADVGQLARVLELPPEKVAQILSDW